MEEGPMGTTNPDGTSPVPVRAMVREGIERTR